MANQFLTNGESTETVVTARGRRRLVASSRECPAWDKPVPTPSLKPG